MRGESLKSKVRQHLHRISKPGYYLGGEVNCVVKDTKQVLGRVCLAFTDTHAIGQIHHGLQVLYSIMNNDPRWACERAFTPWFDFEAMQKAYKDNQRGRKIKGGSTISQQTAKNVFLWQGRSYIRKGLEAYYTVWIELVWGKKRIMEVYLNSIEMGDGVYGAEAAAKHWYRKDASSLTRYEAAGIAAILPNPRKYKASNSSSYINRRKAKISRYIRRVQLNY